MKVQFIANDFEYGFTLGVRVEPYYELEDENEMFDPTAEPNRLGLIIGFILFDILISIPAQPWNKIG